MATFPKALCELRARWTEGGLSRFWRAPAGEAVPHPPSISTRSDTGAGNESAAAAPARHGDPGGSSNS